MVWLPDAELFEEHIIHVGVIMLTAVHQDNVHIVPLEGVNHRFDFHVVGPRPNDANSVHVTRPQSASILLPLHYGSSRSLLQYMPRPHGQVALPTYLELHRHYR
jgi:hypothetical protein